jgi:hypothetical protein
MYSKNIDPSQPVMAQFDTHPRDGHSEAPRFHQRGEESRVESTRRCSRDPSLRLRSGFAQDDASFRFEVSCYVAA